ncbi:MAG: hypothetical protein HPY69_08085 [Armatimonadetes bacterium]|nr:hypothetical protein [Armatimonadota bacterium]
MTPESRRASFLRELQAVGFIGLLMLAWLWPVTLGGRVLTPADMLMVMQPWKAHAREMGFRRVQMPFLDAIQQHYPWRKFAGERLRAGEIPLWNPYMFCGAPFVANNQSAVFYPETWLFALMPAERAFGWAALLSLTMGGSFMYAFLRLLGLRRSSALAGAVPFTMSGFVAGWLLLPTVRAVPMWLPLMLWSYELAVRRRSPGWAATCGLAIGMQFLAGHLHVSMLVLIIFGAYVAFRTVASWRGASGSAAWPSVLGYGIFALAAGVMLAAIQLLPVLELVGMNPRKAGQEFADLVANRMVPAQLLTGLMPNLLGNPVDYNFWGWVLSPTHREYVETVWYYGVAPLLLMGPALAWRKTRSAQTGFWAAVWLAGLSLAWGTAVYWVVYVLVPPARQLPGISRSVVLCCFAGAVLAGMGCEALVRQAESGEAGRVKRLAAVLGGLAAAAASVGGVWIWLLTGAMEQALPGIGAYTLHQLARCLVLIAAAAGTMALIAQRVRLGVAVLLAVIAVDLLAFAAHLTPEVPAKYLHVPTRVIDLLRDDPSVFRMTSLVGDGGPMDRMSPNLPMAFGLQDVQGSDSLVFEGYSSLWRTVPQDDTGSPDPASPVLDMLNCKYLVTSRDLSRAPGWRKVLAAECNVYENDEVWPRASLRDGDRTQPAQPLTITRYEANRVQIEGEIAAQKTILLADTCYPGWKAYLDGHERPIAVANGLLRSVKAEGQARTVEFVYYPSSFLVGAFLTCVAVLALAGTWTLGRMRR